MKYKKARWEVKFEEFKKLEPFEEKIEKLSKELEELKNGKISGDFKTKEEYEKAKVEKEKEIADKEKELDEFKKINQNCDKIENILGFKRELTDKTIELLEKKKEIEQEEVEFQKCDKEIDKLDKEMQTIKSELDEVENKLKNKDLKPEDRKTLEEEKQGKLEKYLKNQSEYKSLYDKKQEFESKHKNINISDKDKIEQEILRNERLMAKCDLIGANLVKGKNFDEINVSLQKFSFTPNPEFAKKIQVMRELYNKEKTVKTEVREPNAEDNQKTVKEGKENKENVTGLEDGVLPEELSDDKDETKLLAKVNKFLQKHPRIAKMIEGIKNVFKKQVVETVKDDLEETKDKKENEKEDKKEETSDFDYIIKKIEKDEDEVLKKVAEKGAAGFRESIKTEIKEKYQANKIVAAENEAAKHKGNYVQQAKQVRENLEK